MPPLALAVQPQVLPGLSSRTFAPVMAPALQLLSSAADGLLKLWSVKSTECLNTFDEHEDKVRTMMVAHAAHAESERPQSATWYL